MREEYIALEVMLEIALRMPSFETVIQGKHRGSHDVILALNDQKQKDHHTFKDSLVYKVTPRTSRAMW